MNTGIIIKDNGLSALVNATPEKQLVMCTAPNIAPETITAFQTPIRSVQYFAPMALATIPLKMLSSQKPTLNSVSNPATISSGSFHGAASLMKASAIVKIK